MRDRPHNSIAVAWITAAWLLLAPVVALPASAEPVAVQPPMKLLTYRNDKSAVSGQLTAYDDEGFDLIDAKGQTQRVAWSELPPAGVLKVYERLWPAKQASGEQWLALGERLIARPAGGPSAERALDKAVKLDPALKERAAEIRSAGASDASTGASGGEMLRDRVTRRGGTTDEPATQPAGPGEPPEEQGGESTGPETVGEVEANAWTDTSDEKQAAAVEKLKAFAEETRQKVNPNLQLLETKYFLFYSDLDRTEAAQWSSLLDRMYARLAELFAVPKGKNIWRGKALVFVFKEASDYRTFQRAMHNSDPGTTRGMCHQYGNGHVHIAFYRQPQELDFANVLVHESVHGFLHRYRSPVHIPSWVNEGLANVIAAELVPDKSRYNKYAEYAKWYLRQDGLDGLFDGKITASQYAIAQKLAEFMIRENRKGYVEFVNGIKDGMDAREAVEQKYGVPMDRLIGAYGDSLGIRGLRP